MDRNLKIEGMNKMALAVDDIAKNFLENILEGAGFQPPISCEQSFSENFEGAVNVEWSENEDYLEAIFYKENLEHIAVFSRDGILQEYRKTLPEGFLPYTIRKQMEVHGEIMNRVLINKGNTLNYEVIVRDKMQQRHLFLLDDLGILIREKAL
jgi:hypothetical protein